MWNLNVRLGPALANEFLISDACSGVRTGWAGDPPFESDVGK
jgi:hypothetical protein